MFRHIPEGVVWPRVEDARGELFTLLEGLTDAQWDTASLCTGWRVRDVLAHLILEYHYTPRNSWRPFVASGFRINTFMRRTAVELGQSPPPELLARFSAMQRERHKPNVIPTINVLVELLVHEQDIRIPLRLPKAMPRTDLQLIFEAWEPSHFNFGEKTTGAHRRVNGLGFHMADLGITTGKGPVVEGTAQDILMALAGRRTSLDELSGEGAAVLARRV